MLKGNTCGVLPIQRENGNGTEILGKSDIFKETETKKGRNMCGCRGACISKNDGTKGRGFSESKKKEKRNKTNVPPPEESDMTCMCKSNSRRT